MISDLHKQKQNIRMKRFRPSDPPSMTDSLENPFAFFSALNSHRKKVGNTNSDPFNLNSDPSEQL